MPPGSQSGSAEPNRNPANARVQINQATTYTLMGLTFLNIAAGVAFGPVVKNLLGDIAKYSPLQNANSVANIATADHETMPQRVALAAGAYSFVGTFCSKALFRLAPGVGHGLLAKDVSDLILPKLVAVVHARADAGDEKCIFMRDVGMDVARQASEGVQSLRRAVQVVNDMPSHQQLELMQKQAEERIPHFSDHQEYLTTHCSC